MGIHALGYFCLDTIKGSATNEENITCIHMDILLVRMLATTLGRHIHHGSLKEFQQSLLNTFTTYISGNAGIIALTSYLIYLIDKYDASLSSLHIIVGNLQEARQDALHVLSHITRFCEYRRVYDRERNIQ